MIRFAALPLLALLAACGGLTDRSAYTCASGPDLGIAYQGETATIRFPSGREEVLTRSDPDRPNYYSAPGISWTRSTFEGRLNDGGRSLLCDEYG